MNDRSIAKKKIYLRRQFINRFNLAVSVLTMGFGLFWLAWILFTLLSRGLPAITISMFTQTTPPPGETGGLLNSIVGSLLITTTATLIGTPLGIFAGTYLAESSENNWIARATRFINDILLSAPSILIGLFVYALVVVWSGHFSGWAGALALSLVAIPVIVRTTEDMLRMVPDSMREAAAALGAPRWRITVTVVFRAARIGILTGILLAVARISGETAPLLFTALNNQFWSLDMNGAMANLPVVIFQYAMSPYDDWQRLAWGGALLITFSVLGLNALARIIFRNPN